MSLEPCKILHMESPRLTLELFRCQVSRIVSAHFIFGCEEDVLLICSWEVIENVEEGLYVELGEDGSCVQERVRSLRIIRCCLEGVPWNIVFGSI